VKDVLKALVVYLTIPMEPMSWRSITNALCAIFGIIITSVVTQNALFMENNPLIQGKRAICSLNLNIMKIFSFFYVVTLLLLFTGCNRTKNTIPLEDKKALEAFFELLVKDHNYAYTLFGSKPVSIAGYNGWDPTSFETLILEKGWTSWCKYSYLFPSQNFVLRRLDFGSRYWINYRGILIINKQAALNTLRTHLQLIQNYLQVDFTAEKLLGNLLEDDQLLTKLTQRGDMLGILLGYGKANAINFEKRLSLSLYIHEATLPPLKENLEGLNPLSLLFVKGYARSKLEPSFTFSSLDLSFLIQELNKITEINAAFELEKSDYPLDNIQTPIFNAVLEDEETKQLYKDYSAMRNKIEEAYKDKPIFEVTINQWMNN
jgi:hypothetical protein